MSQTLMFLKEEKNKMGRNYRMTTTLIVRIFSLLNIQKILQQKVIETILFVSIYTYINMIFRVNILLSIHFLSS